MENQKIIRIEKVTLNIGVGEPGDKLEKAMRLLEKITGKKPVKTITMKRIPTWGVRPGLPIACKVTIRGEDAEKLLSRLLEALDNKLPETKFDNEGNFSFGIEEYLLIPGVAYDMDIGILGLEVAVTLSRHGYRIKRRMFKRTRLPMRHRIKKTEAVEFITKKYNLNIGEEK